ncbi:MAG: hypothetical protein OXE99_08070, partial [Cellvibrionales bacterium]|nr:hypothetical protein [Cellvibrionales bacterium]
MRAIRAFYCWCLLLLVFASSLWAADPIEFKFSSNPKSAYKAGQTITYSFELFNHTDAPLAATDIKAFFSTSNTDWANNNVQPEPWSEIDTTGKAFSTWTMTVKSIGPNSTSVLGEGTVQTDTDFADTVTLAPRERALYEVKAKTQAVAIGDVTVSYSAKSTDGAIDIAENYVVTPEASDQVPSVIKRPLSKEYIPGGWVDYEITVHNPSTRKFANNFEVRDELKDCLTVEMNDGTEESPFLQWQIDVQDVVGEGSDPGAYVWGYGSMHTGNFFNTLDLPSQGKVVYKLHAQVKVRAIGTIRNDQEKCPNTNVIEDGAGLNTPEGKPEVLKEVDKFYYTPGEPVTFTITIKNTGKGPLTNVPVVDDIASMVSEDIHKNTKASFSSWTIKKQAVDSSGKPSSNSNPDVDATVADNKSINTHVNIYPGDSIIYTIVATLNSDLVTPITNTVNVGDGASSSVTTKPKIADLTMEKSVDVEFYSEDNDKITYTIVVKNGPDGGFAKDVRVDDNFQSIQAELLHPKGAMANVFKDVEVTATTTGAGSDAGINPDYKTAGLHAKANIAAGGSVTYTVVGTIDDRTQDHVLWGKFTNTATVEGPDGPITDSADTGSKVADIRPKKVVDVPVYKVGEKVTYTITIENAGDGYGNDVLVTDNIKALGLFKSWTITYDPKDGDGKGTRVIDGVKDNENINTHVDIAPHSTITFYVTGIVVDDISTLEKVTNTVDTHDPQTGRDASASADVDNKPGTISFNVTKVGSSVFFKPGETFTYTIDVENPQDEAVDQLSLLDTISTITCQLANDQGGTHDDIDGHPFSSWTAKFNGETKTGGENDDVIFENFSLNAKETKTLTIDCEVKDNVVSHEITNEVDVMRLDSTKVRTIVVGHASVDNLRADSGGLWTKTVSPKYYKPGDEVTFTIKASSDVGFFNNTTYKESISKLTVDTLDKGPQFPFADGWTITVENNDTHSGGTTDGTKDPVCTVEDNKDLDVIIDVGGGDSVIYTIKGIVIDDASGDIVDGDDVVKPYLDEYRYKKTTLETNYTPGLPLTYQITITNLGKRHMAHVPLVDELS